MFESIPHLQVEYLSEAPIFDPMDNKPTLLTELTKRRKAMPSADVRGIDDLNLLSEGFLKTSNHLHTCLVFRYFASGSCDEQRATIRIRAKERQPTTPTRTRLAVPFYHRMSRTTQR
ncbi:hypothetical protein N7447_009299 [Penicillium robsamsonii]|uniref:uncharacterized protein n=1 Tax=Penicillium robsamsonii TaxID=1792511 RepID=UPI002547BB62|nr:uncharacterized protein N7447_009299 [Penicillium robsamsonii]KAJ5817066.1 hypothetical protein N7447_009299 [Penicillium robsamsonii]